MGLAKIFNQGNARAVSIVKIAEVKYDLLHHHLLPPNFHLFPKL